MPRKSKKSVEHKTKVKNIIQNVVVKLDGEPRRKRRARGRPRKKASERETLIVPASIPAPVIYQTPSPVIHANITPPPPPIPPSSTSPIPATFNIPTPTPAFSKKEEKPLISEISSIKYVAEPKPEMKSASTETKEESSWGVGSEEFAPTASFASSEEITKSKMTPVKVYIEEPEPFKSVVSGNERFGVDESQTSEPPKRTMEDIQNEVQIKIKKERKPRETVAEKYAKVYNIPIEQAKQEYQDKILAYEKTGLTRKSAMDKINKEMTTRIQNPEKPRAKTNVRLTSPRPQLPLEGMNDPYGTLSRSVSRMQQEPVYVKSK